MRQPVFFTDLGINRSYKEIWDLQETMLQENIRLKAEERAFKNEGNEDANNQNLPSNIHQSTVADHTLKSVNRLSTVNRHLSSSLSPNHHLLFVEHNPVYTLGKSGDISNILISEEERQRKKIEFYKINRGGDITFHGPGQLVGYPILDLEKFKTDLGWYLRSLEEVIILTLAEYGLKGDRSKGETGVWLEPESKGRERKICAMGIRCSRWITMHGFAFNVNTNLEYFNHIIPCGIQNKRVTSLEKELGYKVPMEEVKLKVKSCFEEVFEVKLLAAGY